MLVLWSDSGESQWRLYRCYSVVLAPNSRAPMPCLWPEQKRIRCHPYFPMVVARISCNLPCFYESKWRVLIKSLSFGEFQMGNALLLTIQCHFRFRTSVDALLHPIRKQSRSNQQLWNRILVTLRSSSAEHTACPLAKKSEQFAIRIWIGCRLYCKHLPFRGISSSCSTCLDVLCLCSN